MSAVGLGGWDPNRLWLAGLRAARLDCLERRHCESSGVFSELFIATGHCSKIPTCDERRSCNSLDESVVALIGDSCTSAALPPVILIG